MDENPYKSPATRNKAGRGIGVQTILVFALLVVLAATRGANLFGKSRSATVLTLALNLRTLLILLAVLPPLLWAVWVLWPTPKAEPQFTGSDVQYFQLQISESAK